MAEAAPRNHLLASLVPDDLQRLAPHLERVHLEHGTALFDPEQEIRQVWFPESCIVSLTTLMHGGF